MIRVCFIEGLLYGHLLGVADEDGNIQLIDSRKTKTNSIIKGDSISSIAAFKWAIPRAKYRLY